MAIRQVVFVKKMKNRSINITEKSTKTSWGLTCMIMELGIMTQLWVDG